MMIKAETYRSAPVGLGSLLFGMFGGVIAWGVHIGAGYPLAPFVCNTGHTWVLHALNVVTAVAALIAAYVAWRAGKRLQGYDPQDAPRVGQRMRNMAYIGIWNSLFFFLVTVAESLPVYFIDPCVSVW